MQVDMMMMMGDGGMDLGTGGVSDDLMSIINMQVKLLQLQLHDLGYCMTEAAAWPAAVV